MSFLNPTYLWALLGLIIPIAIHLWSKKEGKVIKIGSVQLLQESDSKQTSSISPNEFWLLLLRLLIVALVVFCLAEPQLNNKKDHSAITYLIEPLLLQDTKIKSMLESLEADGDIRLLTSGFPQLIDEHFNNSKYNIENYWALASEMQSLQTDSIVAFTAGYVSGLKGMRPEVNTTINWIVVDVDSEVNTPIRATKQTEQIEILSLANTENLNFEKIQIPLTSNQIRINQDSVTIAQKETLALDAMKPIEIAYSNTPEYANDMLYIKSAFQAISQHIKRDINLSEISDNASSANVLIWLSDTSMPQTTATTLSFKANDYAETLITEGASTKNYLLNKHLNTEHSLSGHLPEQLLKLLNLNEDIATRIEKLDQRVINPSVLETNYRQIETTKIHASGIPISKWLWLFLIPIIIGERVLASIRKQ